MMRYLLLFASIIFSASIAKSQTSLYNEKVNGVAQLDSVISLVKNTEKHILVQVGGNWCKWCREFDRFIEADHTLDSLVKSDFVWVRLNYSKENENLEALKILDYPQRFGFPVLVILDENGKRIHTQNTEYLEKESSYDPKKVKEFLLNWNHSAFDPLKYQ